MSCEERAIHLKLVIKFHQPSSPDIMKSRMSVPPEDLRYSLPTSLINRSILLV